MGNTEAALPYRKGLLEADSRALLPVIVPPKGGCSTSIRYVEGREMALKPRVHEEEQAPAGTIDIEFPALAMISVEHGSDSVLLRAILTAIIRLGLVAKSAKSAQS